MNFISFISNMAMPLIIILIVIYGLLEKKKVFDVFLDGAKEGVGIDFSILLQGAARSSIYLQQDIAWDNFWGNYYEEHIGRWTPETAATATYPRFTKAATAAHPNYYKSDYWLKDSKYLRLKNIQLGYTIPRKLLKKFGVRSLRVYANAYNLFTWDNVKKVDPESSNNSNGQFYPQQKVINFGINLNF